MKGQFLDNPLATARFSAETWLALVGIGEDGVEGLSPAARKVLTQASFVVGGARHLALAGPLEAQTMIWPSPLAEAIPAILSRRGTPTCVLASGDPFFFGVGTLLAAHAQAREMFCLPAPSAFSLAAARLHWSLQDCRLISLHGRPLERVIPALQPGARILSLSWDEATPRRLAALLRERGFGGSQMTIMEAMGGPRERLRSACAESFAAESFAMEEIDPLNLVALEIRAEASARILPLGAALADSWFESDGQLTKREVRAIALSALQPRRGDLLWDIGAGSGSIAIEWLLRDGANRAIAIEARSDRASRIRRNAAALGTPQIEIVEGEAPSCFAGLPQPQAIFVGGGANDGKLLDAAFAALAPGGRFVVNAVTLESEAAILNLFERFGGELIRIDVARAEPLGRFHAFRPALPITQWALTKP